MKILVIAPFYAPYNNPRAQRWRSICLQWLADGHEVHVLTSVGMEATETADGEGVAVHRAGYNAPKEWLHHLLSSRKTNQHRANLPTTRRGFSFFLNTFLEKIYWPDSAFLWIWAARKAARMLTKAHNFDALVSVGLPFSAHLVGLSVHRLRPDMPWIADMGDPFSLQTEWKINNHRLYGWLNFRREAEVIGACTAMTVTTEATAKKYKAAFPRLQNQFKTIGPLLSEGIEACSRMPISDLDSSKIHVGFFGNFYKDVRSPLGLLALLRLLKTHRSDVFGRLQVHLAGEIFGEYAPLFDEFADVLPSVTLHGMLPRREALRTMSAMHILIHVGNITDYQLPSKTVDYLFLDLPVLHISHHEHDPFSRTFGETTRLHQVVLAENGQPTPDCLDGVADFLRSEHAPPSEAHRQKIAQQYGRKAIAQQYLRLLSST